MEKQALRLGSENRNGLGIKNVPLAHLFKASYLLVTIAVGRNGPSETFKASVHPNCNFLTICLAKQTVKGLSFED